MSALLNLFKDIKGEMSRDHLGILLAMHDFSNPIRNAILKVITSGQRAQVSEFEKSDHARQLRTFWAAHFPLVDFHHLPDTLDDTTLDKIYAYYKADMLWKGVSSMLTPSQIVQIGSKESDVQMEEHKKLQAAMTPEEKQQEAEKWRKMLKDPVRGFYGNMNEPDKP